MTRALVPALLLAAACHDVPLVSPSASDAAALKGPGQDFVVGFTHTSGPLAPWNLADPSTKIRTEDRFDNGVLVDRNDYWGVRVIDAATGLDADCDEVSAAPGSPWYQQDIAVTFEVNPSGDPALATEGVDFHLTDGPGGPTTTTRTLVLPWDDCGASIWARFVDDHSGDPSGEWPEEAYLELTAASTSAGQAIPLGANNPVRWLVVDMH